EGSTIWITDEDTGLASDIKEYLSSLDYMPELVSLKHIENKEQPTNLGGLLILSPAKDAGDDFIKDSFRLLKHVGPALKNTGENGGSVLLTVSRMDGHFGLASLNGQNDPASGGIAGLLKTALHEWPEVHCKALDLAGNFENRSDAVSTVVEEMFLDGPVEVGLSNKGKYILELNSAPINNASLLKNPPICEGDVVIITGGARGITAEVAATFSSAFKPTLVLLGRSGEPGPEPDWLAPLADESEIKKQLLDRANGTSLPKQIEDQYREVIVNRELLRNIERIESAGARVIYCSVDVRNYERVTSVLEDIRKRVGPIRGLIHGAGVIADRLIEDKTEEQFDFVYSTKVAGLRALLGAMELDDLKIMVLFSSTTGRYGRTGQVDYAVANEVLNKFAQQQARMRPNCRVVSVNWGPWDGGMVNPSLRKIFEQEGIGLINLKAGANYLVQEICSNGEVPPVEVVVMGQSNGVSQKERLVAPTSSCLSVAFERQLNTEDYPFLKSHVMNGRAVLPMAMMIEWMAHGAMHGNPGMKFAGFNDLRILKGLTLDEGRTSTIRILTGKADKNGSYRTVPVELTGSGGNGNDYVHARADIVLASRLPQGDEPGIEIPLSPYTPKIEEIYNNGQLFHGSDFHGIERMEGYSEQGIAAIVKAAPSPSSWIKSPLRNTWLADPLIIDSSFQMMILWSFEKNGVGSLPSFVGQYRQFQPSYPHEGARIVIRVTNNGEHKALADIDFIDPVKGNLVARIEGYECIIDASLNCAFRCNQLPQESRTGAIDNR
ncbi:MAG: SDR family NAD(P)-dependent oxidoreductase, partial [Deltaproteobacteria bacterium]|nr:SDR family NAD(P)-dependent oxidoreductase [Deltaproteobacteria bacterium]